jgi:Na+/melibiose symporter-like transporter
MYASALPIALAICLLWRQPPGFDHRALTVWVMIMLIVVRLAGGLFVIPSDALAPELAPDYHARTGLISWRWFFGLFGALAMGFVLRFVYLRRNAAHPLGQYDPAAYADFGVTAAVVVFVCIVVSSAATHRYIRGLAVPPARRQTAAQTFREIARVLTNPSLLAIMVAGLVSGLAAGISSTLADFMSYYFWGLTPQILGVMGLFGVVGTLLGVVVAPWLSRALGKKRAMISVFTLSVFTGVIPVALRLLGRLPPNGSPVIPVLLTLDGIVSGALALIGFIIAGSMIADVVEDAAVETGVRSEGLLFAANGLVPKVTAGAGGLIGNMMLEIVRFPATAAPGQIQHVPAAVMHKPGAALAAHRRGPQPDRHLDARLLSDRPRHARSQPRGAAPGCGHARRAAGVGSGRRAGRRWRGRRTAALTPPAKYASRGGRRGPAFLRANKGRFLRPSSVGSRDPAALSIGRAMFYRHGHMTMRDFSTQGFDPASRDLRAGDHFPRCGA